MSKLKGQFSFVEAERAAAALVRVLEVFKIKAIVCGSIRRETDFIGDIDIVAIECDGLMKFCTKNNFAVKNSVATSEIGGIPVSIYFANEENWGSMIMHFTGSKELNIMMRSTARKKGMMLNQYGLFESSNCIASRTEEEIYEKIGMRYLDPTERNKEFK